MKRLLSKLVYALALLSFVHTFAWGLTGHRVVAEIAQRHLTENAKKNIKKLFGNEKLVYYANWPDFIKSDTTGVWKNTHVWHYVNINPQKDFKQFQDTLKAQKGPNLYTELIRLKQKLKDKSVSDADKRVSLIFLMHMMGDMHQPMHTGRAADLGGNKITMTYFRQNTNLHSVWDSKLIEDQKYSYTEYADILDVKTPEEIKAIQSGTLEDWLFESHKLANSIYYHTPINSSVSFNYSYRFLSTAEQQLVKGGLRLAAVLNEIFG